MKTFKAVKTHQNYQPSISSLKLYTKETCHSVKSFSSSKNVKSAQLSYHHVILFHCIISLSSCSSIMSSKSSHLLLIIISSATQRSCQPVKCLFKSFKFCPYCSYTSRVFKTQPNIIINSYCVIRKNPKRKTSTQNSNEPVFYLLLLQFSIITQIPEIIKNKRSGI